MPMRKYNRENNSLESLFKGYNTEMKLKNTIIC